MPNPNDSIIALDVGDRRIGVARASLIARLPEPLKTIEHLPDTPQTLVELVRRENAAAVVIGLPRGLKGQETPQTSLIREFVVSLKEHLSVPIYTQDEALTSHKAEEELAKRGVRYNKGDVDALAAVYILEDFLLEHPDILAK